MVQLHVELQLENDVIMSASAATAGGHRTLHRIRGSALLGACAARGYDPATAVDLFHSNRVRYGDAYPVVDDGVALPLPLALHVRKSGSPMDAVNLAVAKREKGVQLQQQRDGFIDRDGRRQRVATRYSMRTAVGAAGRALEGQLFGIEAIAAGQRFRAVIHAADERLLDDVRHRLVGRTHRLGRSRNAEFGAVSVTELPIPDAWPTDAAPTRRVCVWCISDIALRDAVTGSPRLTPLAADFGPALAGAVFDPAHSFLRFGRWSPFNGYRRRPDLERQVILAGSVLVFAVPDHADPLDPRGIQADVAQGVGEYRNEGLGMVLVQPTLLAGPSLALLPAIDERATAADSPGSSAPDDPLAAWLLAERDAAQRESSAWGLSREWAEAMTVHDSISASQWGVVREMAAAARAASSSQRAFAEKLGLHLGLAAPVTSDGRDGTARAGQGVTSQRWNRGRRGGLTPGQRLHGLVANGPPDEAIVATELLATEMARRARREGGGDRDR